MLINRVNKETTDRTRVILDLTPWLDPGETLQSLVSSDISLGTNGWAEVPYPPASVSPPYDPTPVLFYSLAMDVTQTMLVVYLDYGTAGNAYTCTFVVQGTSARRITAELGVQVTGVPPVEPLPVPVPVPPMPQGALALSITGGTMQGPLYLYADPTYPTEAVTKDYIDKGTGLIGSFVRIKGDTMTGVLTLGGNPVDGMDAATKAYVDSSIITGIPGGPFLALAGGTMTGPITLASDPIASMQPATMNYVNTTASGYLPLSGGTLTGTLTLETNLHVSGNVVSEVDWTIGRNASVGGTLTLAADPTAALQAATKQYVDNAAPLGGPYLALAGGTLTGPLQVTTTTNPLVVSGGTAAASQAAQAGTLLRAVGVAGNNASLTVEAFGLAGGGAAMFTGRAAQGSPDAPAAVVAGQSLANLRGMGFGATVYSGERGSFRVNAAEAYTDTSQGTYLTFLTTAIGGTALVERMRLDDSGALLIGQTARVGTAKLQVMGGAQLDALTLTGPLQVTTTTAPLVISANTVTPVQAPQAGTVLRVVGGNAVNAGVVGDVYGNNLSGGNFIVVGRGAQGTPDAPTGVVANQIILAMRCIGYGATGFGAARAVISLNAAEAFTDTAQGAYIAISTTGAGTVATAERMRIDDSGALLIGQTARVGTAKLQVTGGATLDTLAMTGAFTLNLSGQPLVAAQGGTIVQVQSADAQNSRILIDAVGVVAVGALFVGRVASGTSAARAGLLLNQRMVTLGGIGYGATSYANTTRGSISILGAENWTDTSQGCLIQFQVAPVGGIVTIEGMRLDDSGALLIGQTARVGTAKLQVTGGARLDNLIIGASTGPSINTGAGAPIASAPVASLFLRNDGPAGSQIYANTDGTAAGWQPLAQGNLFLPLAGNVNMTGPILTSTTNGVFTLLNGAMASAAPGSGVFFRSISSVGGSSRAVIETYNASQPGWIGKVAGGTPTAPLAVGVDQLLVELRGWGWAGTTFIPSGGVQVRAAQAFTLDTTVGSYIQFLTTAIGSSAVLERLRITDAGVLQFAITGPSISVGAGAPAATAPAGSIYMRNDGAAGSRVYVSQGATWLPIAGV